MPIYEYRCAACGHKDDHLQKVTEAPLTKCPACGKKKYQKQLSAAGFQLKGSGWYATDFKGAKTEAKAEAKSGAKPEAKAEAKAETKSDAKPEKKAPASTTN
jgi:putative FmdB family regulatory protein